MIPPFTRANVCQVNTIQTELMSLVEHVFKVSDLCIQLSTFITCIRAYSKRLF